MVTANLREFECVPGLVVECWSEVWGKLSPQQIVIGHSMAMWAVFKDKGWVESPKGRK